MVKLDVYNEFIVVIQCDFYCIVKLSSDKKGPILVIVSDVMGSITENLSLCIQVVLTDLPCHILRHLCVKQLARLETDCSNVNVVLHRLAHSAYHQPPSI